LRDGNAVKLDDLYLLAEADGIEVIETELASKRSLSVQVGDGCAIAMDTAGMTTAEEKTMLAHEMGHCETLSFYDEDTPEDMKRKYEKRADRWAMERLVPFWDLMRAMQDGCRNSWELAERFGVTEDMIRKVLARFNG